MDDEDSHTANSDSIHQSAQNTIDEVNKFVLKQQIKHELEKRKKGNIIN